MAPTPIGAPASPSALSTLPVRLTYHHSRKLTPPHITRSGRFGGRLKPFLLVPSDSQSVLPSTGIPIPSSNDDPQPPARQPHSHLNYHPSLFPGGISRWHFRGAPSSGSHLAPLYTTILPQVTTTSTAKIIMPSFFNSFSSIFTPKSSSPSSSSIPGSPATHLTGSPSSSINGGYRRYASRRDIESGSASASASASGTRGNGGSRDFGRSIGVPQHSYLGVSYLSVQSLLPLARSVLSSPRSGPGLPNGSIQTTND